MDPRQPYLNAVRTYQFIKKDLLWSIAGIVVVFALFDIASNFFNIGFDETDNYESNVRSNIALRIDHGTGCHYLESSQGHLVKRLTPDGSHLCTSSQ